MSTLGARIKKARENIGMSQGELATSIGIKPSSGVISNWERDLNKPDAEKIVKLCEVLNISAAFLLDYYGKTTLEFNQSEINHMTKYRFLDNTGKKRIDHSLDEEIKRIENIRAQQKQLQAQQERINALEAEQQEASEKIQSIRIYTYMRRIACAGEGFYFDDIPTETIEAPYMEGADFIIGVNGDSMEPDYLDGDKVYVKKTSHLNIGDVGIFTVGNECYIKEFGKDGLMSRNKDYPDIPGNADIRVIGKVIGTVPED